MNRDEYRCQIASNKITWDIVIIGGGATGMGIAVDAAARGYKTLLLEQSDFGKGTSSRSTKLIHGGIRYLQQGNLSLVMEALKERGILWKNAPHLVHNLRFIVPNYTLWESVYYWIGFKAYDLLAGQYNFGLSALLSKSKTLEFIPTLKSNGLLSGIQYFDGQFDDARLLINLAQTAVNHGAVLLNYAKVVRLNKNANGLISGLVYHDIEENEEIEIHSKCVVNATGAFTDTIIKKDNPANPSMISPSQGIHLVLDQSFLPNNTALMVPKTKDGRVLFAIPWHNHTLLGTTDTPIREPVLEPIPLEEEIDFILDSVSGYFERKPSRASILSTFAGIRPLVRKEGMNFTSKLSREHTIYASPSGLITVCGGKWTTYRKMAEDCVNQVETNFQLGKQPCITKEMKIYGYHPQSEQFGSLSVYGSDAAAIQDLCKMNPKWNEKLHDNFPYLAAEIIWNVRKEMARTIEDCLSRRTRSLLLDAKASLEMAPKVALLIAAELNKDETWQKNQIEEFRKLTQNYMVS